MTKITILYDAGGNILISFTKPCDCRIPPRFKCYLRSSGMLRSVDYLFTDVTGYQLDPWKWDL